MKRRDITVFAVIFFAARSLAAAVPPPASEGWITAAVRDEIAPQFRIDKTSQGGPVLVIEHDDREGLDGYWTKTFPVHGGTWYRFRAVRTTTDVAVPRRSCLVRILWTDDAGRPVQRDEPPVAGYLPGFKSTAEAEHPRDGAIGDDGRCEVTGTYRAPSKATRAVVELHLQWAPHGRVEYRDVEFAESAPAPSRKVRLATIHHRPQSRKSPMDNCREFGPLIAEAARQKADLVVLPETLTYYGLGKTYADVAEPVPGPSTDYFAALAKQHDLYVVAGLYERAGHLIYNVAVLLGPEGTIVGKYRKVCLPRGEVEKGIAPGYDYPVFDTRFGKVGMMVCYDGFFPEVARQLTNRGAEVIAWPVWGCNPALASARACENHVYVVSSTYTDVDQNWMLSAVYDHAGRPLVRGEKWGTVVTAEVDLAKPLNWNSLGDFQGELPRHRPIWSKHGDE